MSRPRNEVHTGDMAIEQKPDIDISIGSNIEHGESLPNVVDGEGRLSFDCVAFMEEPVTIRIEENTSSEYPATHAPVQVQGRGAEVMLDDGKWVEATWLPIGVPFTTKRKYVEVLARSKTDHVSTEHDEANVARPINRVRRRSSSTFPMSIIMDKNPKGHEWLSRIHMGY